MASAQSVLVTTSSQGTAAEICPWGQLRLDGTALAFCLRKERHFPGIDPFSLWSPWLVSASSNPRLSGSSLPPLLMCPSLFDRGWTRSSEADSSRYTINYGG